MERASLETPIRNWQEMIALGGEVSIKDGEIWMELRYLRERTDRNWWLDIGNWGDIIPNTPLPLHIYSF